MTDYVCKYSPVEILYGFGDEARLLNPMPGGFDAADRVTHRNICGFSRAIAETRLGNGNGPLLLSRCCDSIISVGDVLKSEGQEVFILNLPHDHAQCGKLAYKKVLMDFIGRCREYYGREFDSDAFRRAFKKTDDNMTGPYIALMGARLGDELLGYIKSRSPLPVRNNSCTGTRRLGLPPKTKDVDALMEWYADALLSQTPCMRMEDISARRALTSDPNLKGIIYNTVSFCDYYGFEYTDLNKKLRIPMLKIETDYTPQAEGQMKTRLEAFFENFGERAPKRRKIISTPVLSGKEQYTAGIDSGSTSTNAVILDSGRNIVGFYVVPTGVKISDSAKKALDIALEKAGLKFSDIKRTVTTGYGRSGIDFRERDVTEITCHATGAHFLNPAVRTVIDIGGQDSKVIHLDETGAVLDFVMNDKCAAGTGRFLEMMAQSLSLSLQEMSKYGLSWKEEITISSMCSVFAQSEVVSLIAADKNLEDIVHGLNRSVAMKVLALGGKGKMKKEYMMTGGVAKNIGVVREIEAQLGTRILVPREPEICGALGAALIAAED